MNHAHAPRPLSLICSRVAALSLLWGTAACMGGSSGATSPSPTPETPAADGAASPAPPAASDPPAATPPANAPPAPSQTLGHALGRVPASVSGLYLLSLSADRSELTIDPRPQPQAARRAARGGFSARDSENGGKIIELAGGPFRNGDWIQASFRDRVSAPAQLEELSSKGYDLDARRDLLVVDGESDPQPTLFAFSADAKKPGIVGVCSTVTIIDFQPGPNASKPVAVRKPVIYLYPPAPTTVNVQLTLDGDLIADYPPLPETGWTVTASPDGSLVDEATGRHHRYLFWEGTSAGFELDPAQAHLVPGAEAATFMEKVCDRFALTDDECGDFVTYWLPALANNPYSVVQMVDAPTYARYAQLQVSPEPDTVIRPFMIFARSETAVEVGAPDLPQHTREGFTVVEWGGANLDEVAPTVGHAR